MDYHDPTKAQVLTIAVLLGGSALVGMAQGKHTKPSSTTSTTRPSTSTTSSTQVSTTSSTSTTTSSTTTTTQQSGTMAPFSIPNQLTVGYKAMTQAFVKMLFGDNHTGPGLVGKPIYEEMNADGTVNPATRLGHFAFALNGGAFGEQGTLQISPNGYHLTVSLRGTPLLTRPSEAPTVAAIPDPSSELEDWRILCFSVGYRVESANAIRGTVMGPLTQATCQGIGKCSFQVSFPHGTCGGLANGTLCNTSGDCVGSTCEFVRNYLDGAPTRAQVFVGDCPPALKVEDQNWPELWGELKYPGDLLKVNELGERSWVAPTVEETGYVIFSTEDSVAGYARVVHAGDQACIGDAILPPTAMPGNPYYVITTLNARDDGTGGIWKRTVCGVFGATLPVFREDYADSCASGVCVRKMGWTKASLITGSRADATPHLCTRLDGKGTHVVPCP